MTAAGFILAWTGYALVSYGYVLIRGWDISWKQWVNPLNPYSGPWPPQTIPDGTLLP